jgi:hypothetical protein
VRESMLEENLRWRTGYKAVLSVRSGSIGRGKDREQKRACVKECDTTVRTQETRRAGADGSGDG